MTSANGARRVELQLESQVLEPERPRTSAANADTVWFAAWEFGDQICDAAGWTASDDHIFNDGTIYWHMESTFDGQGGIAGQSAAVGYHDRDCCVFPNGYDNDWYQAIRLTYTGEATLSFDYLLDSPQGDDWLQVETDSLCTSSDRVDYGLDPAAGAASFRKVVLARNGLDLNGSITSQALTSYGPGSHCVYIVFLSDADNSPCDDIHDIGTTIGEGVVVDNIVLADAGGTQSEDFEDGTLDIGTFVNLQDNEPFGLWARLHPHVTDNDACGGEVRDCAWIFTDPTLLATSPNLSFGPDGAVVRNWLDNVITSPWVSLPPGGIGNGGTVLDYRFFGGNTYSTSRIFHGWTVRTRRLVDGAECVSSWRSAARTTLNNFYWVTSIRDVTSMVPSEANAIQVRYRVADAQYLLGALPPSPQDIGPGPYLDRVRIGRKILQGPSFTDHDYSAKAQDNFPSVLSSSVPVEDFTPSTDRFGVADFSPPDKHTGHSAAGVRYFKTRDSLIVFVKDTRGAGGITNVTFNAAIVSGPHAGKAPPPWTVGANGFFQVPAEYVLGYPGGIPEWWFVDLDDRYFRGGDVLLYFWTATDAAGGRSSMPDGLSSDPTSVAEAEAATHGLLEVSFLPTIDWDPAYLARIQADASGKLDPTPAELAGSHQANCILYQRVKLPRRRSGFASRTKFTYALDRLGYAGAYDVYDQLGSSPSNSQVMSRLSLEVAGGYALIVVDAPGSGDLAIPDGVAEIPGRVEGFLEQSQWYQAWLAGASTSAAGRATLWLVWRDVVNANQGAGHIVGMECATTLLGASTTLGLHPQVLGQTGFDWADGSSSDFSADTFALATGVCPQQAFQLPTFDLVGATGTGVVTHRFASTMGPSEGAVVMNSNAAASWNTVVMSFDWHWLGSAGDTPSSQVVQLVDKITSAALADSCEHDPDPATGFPDEFPGIDALPRQTALLPNVPNPFNPVTTIHFDLARDGQVLLRIHDVAGRTVRTLVQRPLARRHHEFIWDGLDAAGRQVPSGIYFTRLQTDDGEWTRKLVVLR